MSARHELLAWIGQGIGKPPGWERVVRWLASPESCKSLPDMLVVRDGSSFLAQPSTVLGWNVLFFGHYEPELRALLCTVLPAGGVAIDIGANVGWHTLLMARRAGEGGRVLAIEPNPSVRERLKENIDRNRLQSVDIVPVAIADIEGEAEFYGPSAQDAASASGFLLRGGPADVSATMRVPIRPLDAVIVERNLPRVDVIKIDVEGHEWPLFLGARQSIAKYRPHIVFEYNEAYTARGGGSVAHLAAFFREYNYRLFAIGRLGARAIGDGDWPSCSDIWASPLEREPAA